MTQILVEGLDRLGKSTLIDAIIARKGYHPVIHYAKPKVLPIYEHVFASTPEYEYQYASFVNGFQLIESKIPMIFDRFHLGEFVYSERYRAYDGSYVFDLEKQFDMANQLHVKLVLLTCNPHFFHLLQDDGQSFNWENRGVEQWDFIEAFERSIIPNKYQIDIMTQDQYGLGYRRKTVDEILQEINI